MGCFGSKNYSARIVFVGLDNAGKSSILKFLTNNNGNINDEDEQTQPTIGYVKETIQRGHIELQIWDVGGDAKGRDLWRHYIKNAQAIVFIVDSADEQRIDGQGNLNDEQHAKFELHNVLKNDELQFTAPLLVYANKQDINGALNRDEIDKRLNLGLLKGRPYFVQPSCALNGNGINAGIEWLCKTLDEQREKSKNQKKK
mmetsp:Transcript_79698/g.97523  ORF Transcript_79698/g.97523 Transcript_79698/m.97523 type:complete len:200 (+) Transcript_79698:66-665(+)